MSKKRKDTLAAALLTLLGIVLLVAFVNLLVTKIEDNQLYGFYLDRYVNNIGPEDTIKMSFKEFKEKVLGKEERKGGCQLEIRNITDTVYVEVPKAEAEGDLEEEF